MTAPRSTSSLVIALGVAQLFAWGVLYYAIAVLYGITNGLVTIAKATLPVEMFGLANVGVLLGRFSAPSLVARALAPFAFAWVASELSVQASLIALVGVGLTSLGAYGITTRAMWADR